MTPPANPEPDETSAVHVDIGVNIRTYRMKLGMSLRELARRTGISASALSQIEMGRSMPTVSTLYEITRQLSATPNEIFFGATPTRELQVRKPEPAAFPASIQDIPVGAFLLQNGLDAHLGDALEFVPKSAQHVVTLKGGESCRQLGGSSLPGVDCMRITYDPGAISPGPEEFVRHAGHEFNYVISGNPTIIVGTQSYDLSAGDSLTFPSEWPHRVLNQSSDPADVLCLFVRGIVVPTYEGVQTHTSRD
jgi:transcriptional regulator with XRE-family HTH domain/mannose-6-phosphate isomerase-like protein (cupin superfamily)